MLTTEQKAALKADILANPDLNVFPNSPDGAFEIAILYNQLASPDFIVWRTNVPINEIVNNGFTWTAVDSLTVGKARIWEWMKESGFINPSKVNVRQGLQDAFGASQPNITPHLKRLATRAERLFATGTGSDVSPGTMTFEGSLTFQEVQEARRNG